MNVTVKICERISKNKKDIQKLLCQIQKNLTYAQDHLNDPNLVWGFITEIEDSIEAASTSAYQVVSLLSLIEDAEKEGVESKTVKTSIECPQGFLFGVDCDDDISCNLCNLRSQCDVAQDEIDTKGG